MMPHRSHRSTPLILVVDDDKMQRFLCQEALESAGFEIVEASDGATAINLFSEVRPSLVLLDVLMPGLSGFETCQAIRAMSTGITTPIIMSTGLDDIESIELSYRAGATDFISKPINWALLPHRVRYALRTDEVLSAFEMARDQAQAANTAKTAFLAAMTHEFRTPLNAIVGFAELIAKQTFGATIDGRYLEAARSILQAGERLSNTTTDVFTITRLESGSYELKPESFDLCALVRSALITFRQEAMAIGRDIRLAGPAASMVLFADERAVKQMLLKLLSNAVKFSNAGTPISVTLERAADGNCRLSVEDQGIGMTADEIDMVAQPFRQADNRLARTAEGAGLGLSITKRIMEMHNGNLEIASAPSKGTRVVLNFKGPSSQSAHLRLVQPTSSENSGWAEHHQGSYLRSA
jgi:signal transduction histidine kinase